MSASPLTVKYLRSWYFSLTFTRFAFTVSLRSIGYCIFCPTLIRSNGVTPITSLLTCFHFYSHLLCLHL